MVPTKLPRPITTSASTKLFFAAMRNKPLTVLEVGVLGGASLRTWRDYFPNAKIIGADINRNAKQFEEDRVQIEIMDQSNLEDLTRVAMKHGPFHLIIEDGSHKWEHQITSLRTLFPFVADKGFYVVEDLHTNYGKNADTYKGVSTSTCMDLLKAWLDLCVGGTLRDFNEIEDAFLRTYGRATEFMIFKNAVCLIKKRYPP